MAHLIHRLDPAHITLLARHFAALEPEAVQLRFGHWLNAAARRLYAGSIDFGRDAVFGAFDIRGTLVGVAHLACAGGAAELGLSVLKKWRANGVGQSLLERAMLEARIRQLSSLALLCLPQNQAMMHLARSAGLSIESIGGLAEARAPLQPPTAWTWYKVGLLDGWSRVDRFVHAEHHAMSRLSRLGRSLRLGQSRRIGGRLAGACVGCAAASTRQARDVDLKVTSVDL